MKKLFQRHKSPESPSESPTKSQTMSRLQSLRRRAHSRSRSASPQTDASDLTNVASVDSELEQIEYSGEEDDTEPVPEDYDPHGLGLRPTLTKHRLSMQDASSIIGGLALDDPTAGDDSDTGPDVDESTGEASVTKTSRKVFNFSLPFTNPASFEKIGSIPLFSSLSGSSFTGKLGTSPEDAQRKGEIAGRIQRQKSITSDDEEFYFKDVKKLDSGKVSALRKAMTPSLNVKGWDMSVYDELEGDVVILGGYRGSILRDTTTKRRVWIPVLKAGLNIRKVNLLLGPSDEDEYNAHKTVYSDGMLTHIGPVDISQRLMKRLELNPKVTVHDYGYDWRLSLDISAEGLYKKLREIYESNGNKKIMIIGHSMGGLVAHGAMLKDPSIIRGIIYAGTPCPCVNIMGPMRYNDSILLCNDMLTSEVNFMMRSSFIFVPRRGQCLFKNRKTGEHYDIDFFQPRNWIEYNLSPIVSSIRLKQEQGQPVESKQQSKFAVSFHDAYDYLTRTLKRTFQYLISIDYDPNICYPPMACIYGNRVPSVKYSMVTSREDIKNGVYYDFFYGPGDGVTHSKWVYPKDAGYPLCGKFTSSKGHMSLLSDLKRVGMAIQAILDEEVSTNAGSDTP